MRHVPLPLRNRAAGCVPPRPKLSRTSWSISMAKVGVVQVDGRPGDHGFPFFENPGLDENSLPVNPC